MNAKWFGCAEESEEFWQAHPGAYGAPGEGHLSRVTPRMR
jgi:hypothetical protein